MWPDDMNLRRSMCKSHTNFSEPIVSQITRDIQATNKKFLKKNSNHTSATKTTKRSEIPINAMHTSKKKF